METVENFSIKLPAFEGPFDLLLFFIERDELDIHNIPIARITDDFLDYIHQMNSLNMELASEFIFVAATLMRIKAKMLLPRIEVDEEGNEIDLKENLIQKLIEYKRYKDAVESFKLLEEERFYKEKRGNIAEDLKCFEGLNSGEEELSSFDLYRLLKIYHRMMRNYSIRSEEVKHTVEKYPYTIEEQKLVISQLLNINSRLDFKHIVQNSKDKVQFVYNFLALLEMLQQQLINIQIGLGFNNFWIVNKEEPVQ
ncbi:segregation and condensation protein A [Pseudopedobacter beijingensis]|uniref:Segregation and condensation protein A n=1 Tax=Pseudopedobacter beijingensis TaxID=1207056 RepID=A0ABW4I8G9_9SPHI